MRMKLVEPHRNPALGQHPELADPRGPEKLVCVILGPDEIALLDARLEIEALKGTLADSGPDPEGIGSTVRAVQPRALRIVRPVNGDLGPDHILRLLLPSEDAPKGAE